MSEEKPIVVQNLVKSFALFSEARPFHNLFNRLPRITVLNGISFEVGKGELLGVMGNNGEGKSTLLRVLAGIYNYDSGIVSVRGDVASIFELGSFVNLHYTGREYCREYLYLLAGKMPDSEAIIREIELFTELEEYFDAPIRTYSSGMRAKLLFALATTLPADVFLIDEILMVGDSYFQGKAWARLGQMLAKGTSGVIVTHDWQAVLKLCSRAILLKNHQVDFEGDSFVAVRKYLNKAAQVVRSEEIALCDEDAVFSKVYTPRPNEDYHFTFDIDVAVPPPGGKLGVYHYFHRFSAGTGWQMVFLCEQVVDIPASGPYEIDIHIPDFPLAPGEYRASLEMVVPLQEGQKTFEKIYLRLNWLNETYLQVQVPGANPEEKILSGRIKWNAECS